MDLEFSYIRPSPEKPFVRVRSTCEGQQNFFIFAPLADIRLSCCEYYSFVTMPDDISFPTLHYDQIVGTQLLLLDKSGLWLE